MARTASLPYPPSGAAGANVVYLGAALCRRKFELFYPAGFEDETYLVAERSHKERAHMEWNIELSPAGFRKLLARGEFRDIADAAVRIEARANLLFSFERMALRDAVKTPAGARLFATELHAFLYGHGSPQRRFNDWLEALADLPQPRSPVLTWPVATVFGFIARPDRHMFFKPRATRKAAQLYGYALGHHSKPSWSQYQDLLTFASVLRRDLDRKPGFKAKDMIDLQSFMWVQGAPEYET
ncbi:hypothetical protein LZ009_23205 [Ramlibacter sp. XY19]|uniref:hypothetical protein n=1 Tax=Ramlibacter paludis TaxID=2908000 RepID=UPI0023DCC6D8|nr:hypothetical protein [Ramlibacter paludis]MCG2595696.1 hypothetical protein [Ramlibacter paludis]